MPRAVAWSHCSRPGKMPEGNGPRRAVRPVRLFFALLFLLPLASGCAEDGYQTLEGNRGHFSDFRGQWVLVNYWAEWCPPCREEIPELNAFHARYSDSDAVVLGMHFDQPPVEKLAGWARDFDIRFPVLLAHPDSLTGGLRPGVMPTTYVINPQGKMVKSLVGPQTVETIDDALRQLGRQPAG